MNVFWQKDEYQEVCGVAQGYEGGAAWAKKFSWVDGICWKRWQKRLQVLTMKVLTTFYRRMVLLEYPLGNTISVYRSRLPVDITILTEKDVNAYYRFRPEQRVQEIQARLARGDRCFACWYEKRIIDAGWVATGRVHIPYLRRDLILNSRDIYNYDSYTMPAYRGRGLYMARNAYIARHNWQEGYFRSVALVAVENKAPLVVLQRLGLKPIGLYSCLKFGFWQRNWQQPWGEEPLPTLSTTK